MDLLLSAENHSSVVDTLPYSRWQDIFRSWFWRYYDHLFLLLFFNFGWFFVCFGIVWLLGHWDLFDMAQPWNWLSVYTVYVLESAVSVVWALAVFKIFMEETVSLIELLADFRRYFWKALVASSLSGLVLEFALYNLRFYFSFQTSEHIFIFILAGLVLTILVYGLMMTFYQWPLLFFQDPPLGKLFYRSFMITLGTGPISLLLLFFCALSVFFFMLEPCFWFIVGFVFLFSLYTVALEKHFLRYKITYRDRPLVDYIESMDIERRRGWRDILKPWETR